ncbi:MAG TPA: hypothetical protein VGS41_11580 [Chthonomonadales bacterium]|nr:hypothetical protein [Chthonomonadales bacterium]
MDPATVEDYRERIVDARPYQIRLVSYRVGETYYCKVDNMDPGAVLARTTGPTREEAESQAEAAALEALATTRKLDHR